MAAPVHRSSKWRASGCLHTIGSKPAGYRKGHLDRVAHLGKYHFTMRKSYGVMIFWFLFFGYPNMFLLRDWLDGNILGLFIALLLWSPAFYMLADCIRSRINVYEKGLVYQSLFRRKVVEFTPRLQMYIVRFLEQKYFGWKGKVYLYTFRTKSGSH